MICQDFLFGHSAIEKRENRNEHTNVFRISQKYPLYCVIELNKKVFLITYVLEAQKEMLFCGV